MRLRPCIDIHNGSVVQIIGSSLKDEGDKAKDNFISEKGAEYFADLYKNKHLNGGHIILLNSVNSEYYRKDLEEAKKALKTFPGSMMIGGGVNSENAKDFINMGASHVIVTSFAFKGGTILWRNIKALDAAVGKEHVVLDVSAVKKEDRYFIATDRWQNISDIELTDELLTKLSDHCDEFLVHAVLAEGKKSGIDTELASLLGTYNGKPVTYAGGIRSISDILDLKKYGNNRLDFTVGSALDIFGGPLSLDILLQEF